MVLVVHTVLQDDLDYHHLQLSGLVEPEVQLLEVEDRNHLRSQFVFLMQAVGYDDILGVLEAAGYAASEVVVM